MMNKRSVIITVLVGAGILLAALYQANRSVTVDALRVGPGRIEQYVEETGVVKSEGSQTVYLENGGRVAAILVDEGDRVRRGELLLKLDPTGIRLAEAALDQAEIAYQTARRDWEKAQKLYAPGAISQTEHDNAEAAYKNAAAARQTAELELARQRRNLIVSAPLSGVILHKAVELNQVLNPGDPAFIIGDPGQLEVEADILADDAVKVRPGHPVVITGQTTGGTALRGVVTKVAPMAQNIVSSLGVNQKRATVTIAFTGTTGPLKPGYDVEVKITTQTREKIIAVPAGAVFDLQGQNQVFVIIGGRTRLRPVETGIENDEAIEIRSGLAPDEWVLAKPDNELKEGMKVTPRQAQ